MPMYDRGKVLTGLAIFVIIMTFPVWYNLVHAQHVPKPELPKDVKKCVGTLEYMRTSHMQVLNTWRDEVVRSENRKLVEVGGKQYTKSLQLGCMACHPDRKKFCDECHNYAAVDPFCWDCHFQPKETK